MRYILFLFIFFPCLFGHAQDNYVTPGDTLVENKIKEWQHLKFGLFMHWGTYSQWGVVESWSICPEDEGWEQRRGPYSTNYFEYKKATAAMVEK